MFRDFFRPVGSSRTDPLLVALWIGLILLYVLWLAPFVFIVFTSLKSNAGVMGGSPFGPPVPPEWQNYVPRAWDRGNFSTTVFNSVLITFIKVPPGKVLLALVVFGTMIPFQVMLAPIFRQVNNFGLINTYVGIILPNLAFGVPYQVFILYGFFRAVPRELSEAARIDGANHFTTFRRVFLPISLPVLSALPILDFVATWNEFAMALVILQSPEKWTLPLGLMSFSSQFQADYGQLNAAIVMTVLPAAIVYLIFQRYFVSGLTAGAVKE